MWLRCFSALLFAFTLGAQSKDYSGPRPPKTDLPYLVHGTQLTPMDQGEAKQETKKDDVLYVVDGAAAQAKTPLSEPIVVIETKNLNAEKLSLFRMEVRNGRRELLIPKKPKKDSARPMLVLLSRLGGDLYRMDVNERLENGEYCFSPDGANTVFCFSVF